jgi:hypothetical protein
MARVLMAAFAKAEPEHPITRYPTSFVATFADMARAAIAAAQLADGVPAQSYVADFFREKGFYPSPAQAFAAGVAHAAATQPAAQGMDALTIVEKLPRYTYGYKSDEWGMNRCLRAYQDNAGTFLMRDEVLAALAAQAKQGDEQ